MNEKDDKITHLGILSNLENGRKLARFSNSPGTPMSRQNGSVLMSRYPSIGASRQRVVQPADR